MLMFYAPLQVLDLILEALKVLKRFDTTDVPLLVAAVLRKLTRDRGDEQGSDFCWAMLKTNGFRAAREALLHEHELKISKHLRENVYTPDHFSILRLVGKLSKRLCGLIEQSIKYVHHSDGTKSRQKMCEGSSVPAPSLFALADINHCA